MGDHDTPETPGSMSELAHQRPAVVIRVRGLTIELAEIPKLPHWLLVQAAVALGSYAAGHGWLASQRSERPGRCSVKHEVAADVWFLQRDQPYDEHRQWWFVYEQEHPPIAGYAPGILPPQVSGS